MTWVDNTEFGRECNFEALRRKAQTNESETETDTDDEAQAIQLCSVTRQRQVLTNRQDPHDARPTPPSLLGLPPISSNNDHDVDNNIEDEQDEGPEAHSDNNQSLSPADSPRDPNTPGLSPHLGSSPTDNRRTSQVSVGFYIDTCC